MLRQRILVPGILALLLVAGCGGGAAPAANAQRTVPMAVGYPATSADFTPLYVGVAQGFFKKNGLDVQLKLLHGSSSETSALLSNGVQMIVADSNSVLAGISKGTNVRFVASQIDVFTMSLWAKPSITSVKQLEGHALGLLHVASLSDSAARESLPKLGVDLKKVKIEYLGAPTTAVAALIAGKVPAVVADPPQVYEAQAKGFHELVNFARFPHVASAYDTTPAFIKNHPAEVTDFLKAYIESVAFIKNTANKAAVEKDIAKYTKAHSGKTLDETYNYFRPLYKCDPRLTPPMLADAVQWTLQHSHAKVDVAKFIDTRQLTALEKSGFVKKECGTGS